MRVLIRIGVLNHAARGLRFQNDPGAVPLFQIVRDLHAGAGRSACLRPEFNFGVRLIPVHGNTANIHVHGADVQSTDGVEVLKDAGADGVIIALLLLAAASGAEGDEC